MFDRHEVVAVGRGGELDLGPGHRVVRGNLVALGILDRHVQLGRRMQLMRLPGNDIALILLRGEDEIIDVARLLESAGDPAGHSHAVCLRHVVVRFLLLEFIDV
jgi:hypothetical protein